MSKTLGLPGGSTPLVAILIALALAGAGYADEATLLDGTLVHGKLILKQGRLAFVPSRRRSPLHLDQVHHVRFFSPKRMPVRVASLFRLTLIDGQRLTGELLSLDAKELRFRPTWGSTRAIPRSMIASVVQLPGFLTLVDEDFESDLKAWKITGKAERSGQEHVSGKHSLRLSAPGQMAQFTLDRTVAAGRAGINFHDPLRTRGRRWLVEAHFQDAKGPDIVRVAVAGPSDHYRLGMPQVKQPGFAVPRRAGWHRLQVEFAPKMLVITIDDDLLWVSRERGPRGPLRAIRLSCEASHAKGQEQGEVYFDDLALARAVGPLRHRPADLGQDELWLDTGDQLLGRLVQADRRTIHLQARFGKRTWSWGQVRGIFLRQLPTPPRITDGEQIGVRIRTGIGSEPDHIAGQVRALDDRALSLTNPILGDLSIDRDRVRRVHWIGHGKRIELDSRGYHLGPKGKLVAGLYPPRAEGLSRNWKFDLDALPATAQLHVQVVHMKGRDDGLARSWERGELRTEIVVNGQVIDYLNRHVSFLSLKPLRLSISLPRKALRVGQNTLQLRQTPERKTKHYESCGVANLVIEMPR